MKMSSTLKYFLAVFIYGTIGCILHFINAASEFVVLCRGLLGSLFILAVLLVRKQKPDLKAIKDNLILLVISGIALGLNWVFLFAGYRYAVSLASLCNYTAPIMVVIISALFLNDRLSYKQILCIVASFAGIVLLSGVIGSNDSDVHAIIYGLLAAIGFVILVLCNRRFKNIESLEKTFVQLFISALVVLPFVFVNKSIPSSLDMRSLLLIVMLGIVHTGVAYILYFGAIDTLEPIKIAAIGYVEPVLAVISGTLILKETMDGFTILGAILIIVSALATELLNMKK